MEKTMYHALYCNTSHPVRWFFNYRQIPHGWNNVYSVGTNNQHLIFSPVLKSNSGMYSCFGPFRSSANVTPFYSSAFLDGKLFQDRCILYDDGMRVFEKDWKELVSYSGIEIIIEKLLHYSVDCQNDAFWRFIVYDFYIIADWASLLNNYFFSLLPKDLLRTGAIEIIKIYVIW